MTSFEAQYYEAESFWANGALSDPQNTKRFETTCSLIPEDVESVLDVGCGNGEFLRVLRRCRPKIFASGVDRSKVALSFASASVIEGEVDNLPLPEEFADCVTCLQVIEHLPCNIYPNALRELARCARKYVVIGVPYAEDLRTEIAQCPACTCVFNLNLHVRSFDTRTITNLMDEFGFELSNHVFPCPTEVYWGSQILQRRQNRVVARERVKFISPVCPVCGYTEGDVTPISTASGAGRAGRFSGLISRLVNGVVRRTWPTVNTNGYWIIALYAKKS